MFTYRHDTLHCDAVALSLLAEKHDTPLYVYSAETIRSRYRAFDRAFRGTPHTICYSVKANSNLGILRLLAHAGAGFDVVSGGELHRVATAAKSRLRQTVFSGVGKTASEIDAALRAGILLFNVESEGELELLARRATRLRQKARVALRINPDVAARTHPHISTGRREHKFGVAVAEAPQLYRRAARECWLDVCGVSVHIGSQITDVAPFRVTMKRVAELVRQLRADGHRIRYVDAGGGLGIDYEHGSRAVGASANDERMQQYASAIRQTLKGLDVHLLLEPGRALVGAAGALLTRVLYRKQSGRRQFVIVDAAMNDLLRPALYDAYHEIVPAARVKARPVRRFDVAGPVCETGDFLAHGRAMQAPQPGELLAVLDTGAYGMSLASSYNSRPRPAEVLVDGKRSTVIRRRESPGDLVRHER